SHAWGEDYHRIIGEKLTELSEFIQREIDPGAKTKAYVDTGPILERSYAARAGLGWIGKNSCLINNGVGSFFFLGEILTTVSLGYDQPALDQCGSCTRCLDACPTGALPEPGVLDATRCISYLTIEYKGEFTDQQKQRVGHHLYGCDICQEVCPYNDRIQASGNDAFYPRELFRSPDLERLEKISEGEFKEIRRGSPMERIRWDQWRRNLEACKLGKMKLPCRLGIVDLGTNSVRFDIHEVRGREEAEQIHRERQMVRLGDDLFATGRFQAAALDRTLRAFDLIHALIARFDVKKIVAFGTSALRESRDGPDLIAKIKERTGISIKTISGQEEASLIAKGILANEKTPEGLFGLVDIGGGSTEVCICRDKKMLDGYSLNLGASRLNQIFPCWERAGNKKPNREILSRLRSHIREIVKGIARARDWPQVPSLIGSSGTILAFRNIMKNNGDKIDPFREKTLNKLVSRMSGMSQEDVLDIPGMDPERADLILPGGILLEEIVDLLGAGLVYTTNCTLRDGLLQNELDALFINGPVDRGK
ncbi:MAG: tRNA epoxyqueuosine(34) reductase QueG, partial [Deltaproteobacteria bacterium]|nr:tRNA epoxyqueuosine(34) reductase QueG [Deltaproteobacteria bacterium]